MNSWRQFFNSKLRLLVQIFFILVVAGIGIKFMAFLQQAYSGQPTISRPAGVEGFLPVSALVGLKSWLSSGTFDQVHPAGLVIFLLILGIALLFKRGFCAWICPIGTLVEGLGKLGKKLFKRNLQVPKGLDYALRSIKYVLLGAFLLFIGVLFSGPAAQQFAMTPYNITADAQMVRFFQHLSLIGILVIGALAVLSLLIENFWCRYLCPYGALTGLLSFVSLFKVERNEKSCTHCGACTRACPNRIRVDTHKRVSSPECNGCLNCVKACPVKHTLNFKTRFADKGLTIPLAAACLVILWFGVVGIAKATGHWQSQIPAEMYAFYLKVMESAL